MIYLKRPTRVQIENQIREHNGGSFSYRLPEGALHKFPSGFKMDHHRVFLGKGLETYRNARTALSKWQMFNTGWTQLCWEDSPIKSGTTVAILTRILGMWVINMAKIVCVIDKDGNDLKEFGFSYGTLKQHVETGEERFLVMWDGRTGCVHYDIRAFSRPNHPIVWLGYPYGRYLQKCFAKDSMEAMLRSVKENRK